MCYSATAVANFFIREAIQNKASLTHLHLQKILFFAHAEYFHSNKKPLFSDPIVAWQHGPVIESIYHELKQYNNENINKEILKIDIDIDNFKCKTSIAVIREDDKEIIDFLKVSWNILSIIEPWKLRNLSHAKGGAWYKTVNQYVDDPNNDIEVSQKLPRNLTILDNIIMECGR